MFPWKCTAHEQRRASPLQRGGPLFAEINNKVESCTVCAPPSAVNKSPPAGIQVAFVARSPPFTSSASWRAYQKNSREHEQPSLRSLSLSFSFSRVLYRRDKAVAGLGGEERKRRKGRRNGAPPRCICSAGAFYLGSACSEACGRSLPAVYQGRKQWPR